MKETHCGIPDVVLHHLTVRNPRFNVPTGVLKNASGSVQTFVRIVHEVLANRSQILFVEILLPLELLFAVGKATSLSVVLVLAGKPFKPKTAELCLNFSLPAFRLVCLGFLRLPRLLMWSI